LCTATIGTTACDVAIFIYFTPSQSRFSSAISLRISRPCPTEKMLEKVPLFRHDEAKSLQLS
jgi:hypothetical protein